MNATNEEEGGSTTMNVDQEAESQQQQRFNGTAQSIDQLESLLSAFRRLSDTIVHHINNRYEPVEELAELNKYLSDHTKEVQELLHLPRHLLTARQGTRQGGEEGQIASGQEASNAQATEPNIKLEFYENVFMKIATAIMNEEVIQKPEVSKRPS